MNEATAEYLARGANYQAPIKDSWFESSTQGVEVAVYDLGGSGPTLVIAHATGFCGPAYGPFASALVDRFHCYAFDFRAHGASSRPEGEL